MRKYSILSCLLVTAIAALSVALYEKSEEASRLEKTNDKLNARLGMLNANGEDVVVRKLAATGPNAWSFRVFVPNGKYFKLTCEYDAEPAVSSSYWYHGQFDLHLSLFQATDGEWYVLAYLEGGLPSTGVLSTYPPRCFKWPLTKNSDELRVPASWSPPYHDEYMPDPSMVLQTYSTDSSVRIFPSEDSGEFGFSIYLETFEEE